MQLSTNFNRIKSGGARGDQFKLFLSLFRQSERGLKCQPGKPINYMCLLLFQCWQPQSGFIKPKAIPGSMEIIPEGKNFRLVHDDELNDILEELDKYLPEALKVSSIVHFSLSLCVPFDQTIF